MYLIRAMRHEKKHSLLKKKKKLLRSSIPTKGSKNVRLTLVKKRYFENKHYFVLRIVDNNGETKPTRFKIKNAENISGDKYDRRMVADSFVRESAKKICLPVPVHSRGGEPVSRASKRDRWGCGEGGDSRCTIKFITLKTYLVK